MVHIRDAVPADAEVIHLLGEKVSEFSVNDATVTFWPLSILRKAIISEDVVILVAVDSGKSIVGFIIAAVNHGLRKATIENIFVIPSHRDRDVGKRLLDNLLARLVKHECEYVVALVPPGATGALNLYEGAGFSKGEIFVWLDKPLQAIFRRG